MTDSSWHTDAFPELRAGPPWVMAEMMHSQGAVAEQMLADPPAASGAVAQAINETVRSGLPVVVCGCGTSEHAAHGIAAILAEALPRPMRPLVRARPALSAAFAPDDGLCIGISHDGETRATVLALEAARQAGARTAAITNRPGASVARVAGEVILTPRHDDSWCHTVAYSSALTAGIAVAARVSPVRALPSAIRALYEQVLEAPGAAAVAERLADRRVVLCAGLGPDQTTARELALKIAEGARMPTVSLELETVLHGQLAGHEPADALVLVTLADHRHHPRLARRAAHVAAAAGAIGIPVAGLVSRSYDRLLARELTPAGRITVQMPPSDAASPTIAALSAGAAGLQALTLELAHARGTNPDLIRREQAPYREAARLAEEEQGW